MRAAAIAALLLLACRIDWQSIPRTPLRAYAPHQPRRVVLGNGMVLFLQEDRELPLISGSIRVRGGANDEPAAKVGLVEIFGDVWRTGGTQKRGGDELDDFLERRAAEVETSGDGDSTGISWSCLRDDFDDVFAVVTELLREPAFREDKIRLAKLQLATAIARRNDNARRIAAREARKLTYGATSPLGRTPELATVRAVTRDDLVAWHASHLHPRNLLLGIIGDFDASAMEAKLRAAFDPWPAGPEVPRPASPAIDEPKPGVYFIAKDDVNQTEIRVVHLGVLRSSPDFYALTVLNEILGGGSGARLQANLRTKRGLAYAVGGGVGIDYGHPGITRLSMGTRSRQTAAAIEGLLAEVDDLTRKPPTLEEIQLAKDSLTNSFIFRFDTRGKVLDARLTYEFYGYPADLLERYRSGIEQVTLADVARVAREHIRRERFRILVVGKAADFDRPLSSFGAVTPIDITIPKP